ncbi:MAG: hypothetical protein ACOH5I_11530 [Oligoflexus sp.]
MQGQLEQLMQNFRRALETHEMAVQDFLKSPNESNSERMADAYEQAIELRHTLKALLRQNQQQRRV